MVRSHSLVAWAVVFAFLAAANLCAADKKPKHPKSPENKPQAQHAPDPLAKPPARKPHNAATQEIQLGAAEAKIEEALASVTQLEFNESPLQDVIDYLKETKGIEIQLDRRVLEDVNVTKDTPATINVKGITLESALRLMLRNMQPELTYMIKNEVLLITTPDVASEELVTKLYPVGDLVGCRDEHDAPWDDYDALIDVITSTTKPTTWDTVGAPGSVQGNTFGTAKILVVTQTREVHEEIADLLAKIREIAKNNPNAGTPRRSRPVPPPPGSKGMAGGSGAQPPASPAPTSGGDKPMIGGHSMPSGASQPPRVPATAPAAKPADPAGKKPPAGKARDAADPFS